jgi:hypothetical protein
MGLRTQGPDDGRLGFEVETVRTLWQRYAGCSPPEGSHRVDDPQVAQHTHPGTGPVQVEILTVNLEVISHDGRGLPDSPARLASAPEDQHLAQVSRGGPPQRHRERSSNIGPARDDERLTRPDHFTAGLDVDRDPPRRGATSHVVGDGARGLDDLEPAPLTDVEPQVDLVAREQQGTLGDEGDPDGVAMHPEESGSEVGPPAGAVSLHPHPGRR